MARRENPQARAREEYRAPPDESRNARRSTHGMTVHAGLRPSVATRQTAEDLGATPSPSGATTVTACAIRLEGFVKRFGPLTAVDGLDLEVPFGTCVGLLGPNGAGKSTTMKALTAQVIADEGTLEVLGHPLPADSKQARAEMGVVPQLDNLDVSLTVEQNLLVFVHLYRVPAAQRQAAIGRTLDIANLTDRRTSKVEQLSGGMRRRLLIARALLHQPRLLLLDEPTVGLDPQVRQELWSLIDRLRSDGVSILMSTHYIEEAERLCDRVTIMSHGKAVAEGPPRELIAEHAGAEALEVYGSPSRLAEVEDIAQRSGWRTRRTGTSVSVLGADGDAGAAGLEGERRVTNLEDVFVLLTGEEIT
jgi:lipooligosaccharide transport system ATP-binding protein